MPTATPTWNGCGERQLNGAVQLKDDPEDSPSEVTLEHYDPDAETKLVTALLFRSSRLSYSQVWRAGATDATLATTADNRRHPRRYGPPRPASSGVRGGGFHLRADHGLRGIPGIQAPPDADLYPPTSDGGQRLRCPAPHPTGWSGGAFRGSHGQGSRRVPPAGPTPPAGSPDT